MLKWEDIRRSEADYRSSLKEYVKIGNKYDFEERLLARIEREDKNIALHLGTPIGEMDKEYRDAYYLLFSKDNSPIPKEYVVQFGDTPGRKYDKRILFNRLISVVRKYLLKTNDNLDSDSFDITPYFSMINETDIIAGFMFFQRDPKNDHHIIEVGLFSFDVKNKEYGRQVWEDFDECIIDYLSRGYMIDWSAWKENKTCNHYDELIKTYKGSKIEDPNDNRIWKYHIGDKKCSEM